jgi:DNA invertase Pin-like site-specific DNA recombinase
LYLILEKRVRIGGYVALRTYVIDEENGPMPGRAIAYLRTSSASNVGGDSDKRQRETIGRYAKGAGIELVAEYYDAAVSGADRIDERQGFAALLAWAEDHPDARTIIVENASRFARDIIVQETGYRLLLAQGFTLIAADDPDAFTADTSTADLVRQILGAVAQFEKANLVAKLKAARDRMSRDRGRRIEGRKGYRETDPALIREAKRLARKSPRTGKARSLREIATELARAGHLTAAGNAYSASQVQRLIAA